MMTRHISGAGGGGKGGGGGPRVAQEAPDSLRSNAFARVLDLVSEGEIEGLVSGLRSVYLDGTPVQNTDGSFNFTGVTMAMVNGTQSQDPLPGLPATETPFSVGVAVVAATPVVRTITNVNADAVRVTLSFPGLSSQNTTNGDLNGTSVEIAIAVQSNGGGYVTQSIGREWRNSPNPMVLAATGLSMDIAWSPTGVADAEGNVTYSSIEFLVQYREVGAGTWITFKTDTFTTSEFTYTEDGSGFTHIVFPTRTYDILGLVDDTYEARLFKNSGDGSVGITSFRHYTATPFDIIAGKTVSTYQRSYRIPLTGSPPWDVKVTRITPDSASSALRNATAWASYVEITDEKFNYPNSAVVAISVDASQFQSVPTRSYDMKLLRVKIPSNYNPITRVYTGTWDGTFTVAWTDNPAWCFYDLMTNARYGLGAYLPAAQVDKWALYAIGQYCDAMVPNGYGVQEPRFTCNVYLQTQREAFEVAAAMASIFRGMAYWAGGGAITAVQDSPSDPVFLFTEANVENGLFTYSGSSKNARHTVAMVMWNDPADNYALKPEYVEDLDGIARYGIVTTEVTAFGCTSRGQANRVGRWILYSERLETEGIAFTCGMDGVYLRPGSVFAVQDQHRAGVRYGGRITAATSTSLTIDNPITINSGETYTVKVVLPDGTLDTRTVTNGPGSTSVLNVSVAFTVTPVKPAIWILTSSALSPRLYRALSISEVEPHRYEVQGIAHNPSKYNFVEQGLALDIPRTSLIEVTPAPVNVTISESLAVVQGIISVVVRVEWEPSAGATRYRAEYRRDSGSFISLPETTATSVEISGAVPGYYEVRVYAISTLLTASLSAIAAREILGKMAPPSDVTDFIAARNGEELSFSWRAISDLDVSHYELRQGTGWEAGVVVADRIVATRYELTTNVGGTYLLKAVDTSGIYSINAAVLTLVGNFDINVVVTANDNPSWAGVKTGTQGDSAGLTLENTQRWNTLTNTWDTYTASWYQMGSWGASGTYVTVPIDLGVVLTSRIEVAPETEQLQLTTRSWTSYTAPWLSYTDPWTGDSEVVGTTYEIATSQDAASYTAYGPFQSGVYTARAVKFRITLTSTSTAFLPRLKHFVVTVDVPDRIVHFEDHAIEPGGTVLTFSPAFIAVQTVTGTIQGGAIGDTFRVTGKTTTSAMLTVYDAAGNEKYGTVDIDVFGYGEQ